MLVGIEASCSTHRSRMNRHFLYVGRASPVYLFTFQSTVVLRDLFFSGDEMRGGVVTVNMIRIFERSLISKDIYLFIIIVLTDCVSVFSFQ